MGAQVLFVICNLRRLHYDMHTIPILNTPCFFHHLQSHLRILETLCECKILLGIALCCKRLPFGFQALLFQYSFPLLHMEMSGLKGLINHHTYPPL